MDPIEHKLQHRQLGISGYKEGLLLVTNEGITQDAAATTLHEYDTVQINTTGIPLPTLGAGTYTRSGSTFTISFTGHGLTEADVGKLLRFQPTSGGALTGFGVIQTVPDADTYTLAQGLTALGGPGNMVHKWNYFCVPLGWTYARMNAQTFWLYDDTVRSPNIDPVYFSHGIWIGNGDHPGSPGDDRPALWEGDGGINMCFQPTGPSGLITLPTAKASRYVTAVGEVGNVLTGPISCIIAPNSAVWLQIELFR
jgi:hypothetical protein